MSLRSISVRYKKNQEGRRERSDKWWMQREREEGREGQRKRWRDRQMETDESREIKKTRRRKSERERLLFFWSPQKWHKVKTARAHEGPPTQRTETSAAWDGLTRGEYKCIKGIFTLKTVWWNPEWGKQIQNRYLLNASESPGTRLPQSLERNQNSAVSIRAQRVFLMCFVAGALLRCWTEKVI